MSLTVKKWIAFLVTVISVYCLYLIFNVFFVYSSDAYTDNNVVSVSAYLSGKLTKLNVHNGQKVKKGDLLFEVDPAPFLYTVQEKAAAVKSAQVAYQVVLKNITAAKQTLELAKLAQKNASILYEKQKNLSTNVLSVKTVKELEYDLDLAKATTIKAQDDLRAVESQLLPDGSYPALLEAKAALKFAKYNYEQARVYAPVDGVIENIHLYEGEFITAGQTLFALVPDTTPWVTVRLKEQYLDEIKSGDKVTIYLYTSGGFLSGKVRSINRAVNRRQSSSSVTTSPLPYLEQTEDWIELAQRFPISIELDEPVPYQVAIGASAIVLIHRS